MGEMTSSDFNCCCCCCLSTAAKAALRRKKGYEKNLEQTTAQVAQLEQQIYSIEAANINQETLNAMKAAGSAMSQIHKGMTIDKVDETMYVFLYAWGACVSHLWDCLLTLTTYLGINSGNNINSARKSLRPLRVLRLGRCQTKASSTRNSKAWSRRRWTSACSSPAQCPLRIKSAHYLLRRMENVCLVSLCHLR